MTPKFSVGEVVILQSVSEPEKNGEYTIVSRDGGINAVYGGDCFVYELDGASSGTIYWAESALSKKHQPGEYSFTDLMAMLKNPVNA